MLLVMGLGLLALLSRAPCACQDHRIIPKSIFVLPSRTAKSSPTCPQGLAWDTKQAKCLNIFRLNQTAQNRFLLERLQMRFPLYSVQKHEDREEPFHVELSLEETGD